MATLNAKRSAVPVDLALTVSALPNNTTFPTTAFPGWTCPVPTMTFSSNMGGTQYKVLTRTDDNGAAMATSDAVWRDVDTKTFMFVGIFFNRFANGRGIYLKYNNNDSSRFAFELGVAEGVDLTQDLSSVTNGTRYGLYTASRAQLEANFGPSGTVVPAGYTAAYQPTHFWRLRTVGFDIVVYFQNTPILTFKNEAIACMDPGKVVLAPSAGYGGTDTLVDFQPQVVLQSDMTWASSNRKLVLSELGWKNSKTAGSMAAGSAVITTTNTTGFAVGDGVIVATGGEASGGARGEPGVGGYLNDEAGLLFPSLAALLASTSPDQGIKAYVYNIGSPDHGRRISGSNNGDAVWYGPSTGTGGDAPVYVQLTLGSPGIVRLSYWNLKNGWPVTFAAGSTLPTGLVAGVTYYVKNLANANQFDAQFNLAAAPDTASTSYPPINFTGSQSGNHILWRNMNWYVDFIPPKALNGTIVSIVPNVSMTLNVPARVGTTNADVYHDNISKADHLERVGWLYPTNVRCLLSGLDNAIRRRIKFSGRHGWTLEGISGPTLGPDNDGLIAPKGSPCEFTEWSQCKNTDGGRPPGVRNMRMIGNHFAVGYGCDWAITTSLGVPLPKGNAYNSCVNPICENLKVYYCFSEEVSFTSCYQDDLSLTTPYGTKNIYVRKVFQEQVYMGWMIVSANNTSGGMTFDDCYIERDWYGSAFETFQEFGVKFRNCRSLNGVWSVNSGGGYYILNPQWTFQPDKIGNNTISNPAALNLNNNQDNLQGTAVDGITLGNPTTIASSQPHGLVIGDVVGFHFFGSAPTGMGPGTPYFVIQLVDAFNFRVSATAGGPSIVTSGSYNGLVRWYRTRPAVFTIGNSLVTTPIPHTFVGGTAIQFFTSNKLPDNVLPNDQFFVLTVPSPTTFTFARFTDDPPLMPTGTQVGPHIVNRIVSDAIALGGTVENPTVIRTGPDDAVTNAGFFTISVGLPNAKIIGTHPNGTGSPYVKGTNPKGYFIGPVSLPGGGGYGIVDLRCTAAGVIIDGIRCATADDVTDDFKGRIYIEGGSAKVINCVADAGNILGGALIVTDVTKPNITNAAWLASHTPNDG